MAAELTLRTTHPDVALVAAALRPDNTSEMTTAVEDGRVVTRIGRPELGSLRATADDYQRCLAVAEEAAAAVRSTEA